jgi:hypothetical protein
MRIEIECPSTIRASETVRIRASLFNDSYEPVAILRRAFIGPNVGYPRPDAVEPGFGTPEEPLVLQPFTYYGRERVYDNLPPGQIQVTARYSGSAGSEIVATRILTVS